ncbi:MAG: hypothetical protein ACKVQJ_09935 [Pyrinomonadaceae bacterium]
MRKIQIGLMCAVCLFAISNITAQKAKETMTNAKVVEMVKNGVPESTILLAIQQSEPSFDTSSTALIELSKQGVGQKILDAMFAPQPTKAPLPIKVADPNAIATKDIGSLRVVLKSIMKVKLPDKWGDMNVNGIRCSFEFINLETQRPIFVAMNAIAPDIGDSMGSYLRSTLVDENGGLWRLKKSDIAGMNLVGVGWIKGGFSGVLYDPAQIGIVLSKRDDLNSDVVLQEGLHFVYGSMTEMTPGQSLTVTASFSQNENQKESDTPPRVFQMATEIVVGIPKSDTKKAYTLYNLTFDRVALPTK